MRHLLRFLVLTLLLASTLPADAQNKGRGSAGGGMATTDVDTSAELRGILTDETGTGAAVFGTAPTIDSPVITTKMNPPSVTAFPGTPSVGDVVIVTDDSAAGACDSAAGTAVSICRWSGAAWVSIGDGNSGTGAPTNATYLMQTANGSTSNEQALGALSTGCLGVTTTTGVVASRTITGTANQITVTSGDCSAAPTISIPTNPTLPGTTTGTFSGNITGAVTGNASTATALAANGGNCAAGQFPLGVDASGAVESCTALPTTIAGTANEVAASAATGAVTLSLPATVNLAGKILRIPSSITLPATCTVGDVYMDTNATTGQRFYACEATDTWVVQGVGGSGAPTDATYLMQTANGSTSNEQAIGALATGCMSSTTTTGVVATRTITGTANQITVTSGDCSGNPTISIPSSPTLPGTVSATAFTATGASTGVVQMNGVTSGAFKLTTPDATGQTVTLQPAAQTTGAATFTLQDAAGVNQTIATLAQTQTLTNKTLTTPVIASISNGGTMTVPSGTDTLVGKATTDTLTNKTLDCEGTGNVCTIPKRIYFPAAGCNNATAGSVWDLPTSNPAVAACVTGTNTQKGVLNFADGSNLSAQLTYALPTTWSGAIDARIKWYTSATSGSAVWQLSTICVADAETDDPAFNTASTVTDAAKGTTLQTNDAAITGVTATGCAAGELMHLKIQRDSGHASDNLAATASLIGVELTIREAL